MIRQQIFPLSPMDERLARLAAERGACRDGGGCPPSWHARMRSALASGAEFTCIAALARDLETEGFPAAAAAAWERAARSLAVPAGRAPAYAGWAELARRQGCHFLADGMERRVRRLEGRANYPLSLPELEADGLWVVCAPLDPEGYADARAALGGTVLDRDPLRDPGLTRRLFFEAPQADACGRPEDYSFLVSHADAGPLVVVECDVLGDRALGCREAAVAPLPVRPDHPATGAALGLALRQMEAIAAWAGCPYGQLEIPMAGAPAALVQAAEGAPAYPLRHAWIELVAGMEAIRAAYRPTTRQRLRQGMAALDLVAGEARRAEIMTGYDVLHRGAGRTPGLSPATLAGCLETGEIRGYLGLLDGAPAAMVLASRHGDTVYDMATVKREDLRLPLSHALVDAAIADAAASGAARFHFGPLYEEGHLGAKMAAIAEFKRGFASSFAEARIVRLFG